MGKKAKPIAVDNNKTITQADYQAMPKKISEIEKGALHIAIFSGNQ